MASKVYVVDDDVDMVTALKANLENAGYEVKAQYDDKGLVENVKSFDPDVIVLDVMFPEDDAAGFHMARTLRKEESLMKKPVIMLTGVNTEGDYVGKFTNRDIDESFLPITEFVDKPVDPKDLIALIEKHV